MLSELCLISVAPVEGRFTGPHDFRFFTFGVYLLKFSSDLEW